MAITHWPDWTWDTDDIMNDIFFLRPNFLYLCFPFAIIFLVFIWKALKKSPWQKICSKDLSPHVLDINKSKSVLNYLIIPFTFLLLILGLAGPSWSKIETPIFKEQSGLVLVLDLSDVMNAEDVKPSRLKRAVYKINDLLNVLKTKQVALVVFSEKPFVVTPLTDDIANIKAHLSSLQTHIMPSKGHRVDLAVQKALDLLNGVGISDGSILLITPEISDQEISLTSEIVKKNNIKLSILGAGLDGKTPIAKADGGFIKDESGALVMHEFAEKKLRELAKKVSGMYVSIQMDDQDIHMLEKGILGVDYNAKLGLDGDEKQEFLSKWQDQGYLFALLAIPFLLLIFRPGFLLSITATAFFIMPNVCQASNWSDYFYSSDKKGETLFHLNEYREAKEHFEDPNWKACAHFKLDEFRQAADLFKEDKTADGFYNYGTTKAKLNDFEEALKAYDAALALDPEHMDAKHNKELIEEFLKEQQEEKNEKKDKEKNKTDKKQDTKNDSQNQKEKDSENKENHEGDGSEKDDKEKLDQEDKSGEDEQNQASTDDKTHESEVDEESQKKLNEQYKESLENENLDKKEEVKDLKQQEPVAKGEENQQKEIDERLLRRVKDDPSELLRRKFLQQYRNQSR